MIFLNFNKRVCLILVFFIGFFGLPFFVAQAQSSPEIWMTWKASSYVPADFSGKAMPSEGTLVTAAFEVVDGGRFVNLASYEIYWYLNDELIQTGMGGQQVSFRVPSRGNHELRVKVNNYNNEALVKTIEIPSVFPEAVIVAPYPNNAFSNSRIQVRAVPYFFNITDPEKLGFSWKVNGQKPDSTENISFLDINLGGGAANGYRLQIDLVIFNPFNTLFSDSTSKTMTFQK